jgi:hypothetical protein
MSPDVKQYELDRVNEVVKSLGYSVTQSGTAPDKVFVSTEKVFPSTQVGLMKNDVDRLINMLKLSNWSMTTSSMSGEKAVISFEKAIKPEV